MGYKHFKILDKVKETEPDNVLIPVLQEVLSLLHSSDFFEKRMEEYHSNNTDKQ
tara:strand:+ start:1185 stop:1346 length:162 start_codon:yes stop_codon:yes gene_type:complete